MRNVIKEILQSGGKIYEVGGCVRDRLFGRPSKDTDYLVTGLPMEDLVSLLENHGGVNLVGKSFGVIKFKMNGVEYDIALPRKEESTGTGHRDFAVNYSHEISLEDDLFRRDFRLNAIARNPWNGQIIDPFGGVSDIRRRRLRIVSHRAFVEDPLRMLRAVQFVARLGVQPDDETFRSMQENAALVATVSPERIASELVKLLLAGAPSSGFRLMQETGLLVHVIPELAANVGVAQPAKYHAHDVFGHCLLACDKAVARKNKDALLEARVVALLHDIGKYKTLTYREDGAPQFLGHEEVGAVMAREVLERLRFTSVVGHTVNVDRICDLVADHMFACDCESTPKSLRKFVAKCRRNNKHGMDYVFDLIRLRIADRAGKGLVDRDDRAEWVSFAKKIRTLRHGARNTAFGLGDLALNGRDLIAFGMKPGKAMGAVLAGMLDRVLENPELNTREGLLGLLEKTEGGITLREYERET